MSIESVILSNHLILCHPLLLPSVFPSIRVFSNESALRIRGPTYWSFSNRLLDEYSGLISFWIDWFDLLAVQGTLQSLLQHQFESRNSLVLSLLYCPSLTSIHDYWKSHNFDKQLYSNKNQYLKRTNFIKKLLIRNKIMPLKSFRTKRKLSILSQ